MAFRWQTAVLYFVNYKILLAKAHFSDIIYGLITSNDLSNRTTALLDVNVHIPPMSATPQDQLRAYADSRRKRNIMNDMYMEYFPSDFLADGTAPPGVPNHTYDWNNQKKNSIAPVLDDSTTTEFRSHFLEPTLAAAFRMSAEPFQVNSPVGDLPGTQYSTSFDQTDEGFEMWSTLPSGNKFVLCFIPFPAKLTKSINQIGRLGLVSARNTGDGERNAALGWIDCS